MSRYAVVKSVPGYGGSADEHMLDLPSGPVGNDGSQHIHLTLRPDGTWTAVAMEEAPESTHELVDGAWQWTSLWVDVPTDPEDGR